MSKILDINGITLLKHVKINYCTSLYKKDQESKEKRYLLYYDKTIFY